MGSILLSFIKGESGRSKAPLTACQIPTNNPLRYQILVKQLFYFWQLIGAIYVDQIALSTRLLQIAVYIYIVLQGAVLRTLK